MSVQDIRHSQGELEDHIAVAAFIHDENGDLYTLHHNKWDVFSVPTGKAEGDETAEDAVRRELKEELGISRFDCNQLFNYRVLYHRLGKDVLTDFVGFEVVNLDDEIKNLEPSKHRDAGFSEVQDILTRPRLSDFLILYLNEQGVEHDYAMEGTLV